MATNLVQNGERIKRTVVAAVVSGRLYSLAGNVENGANGMPVIAAKSGAIGDSVDFITEGVFQIDKVNEVGSAVEQGDQLYWKDDGGINKVTGLATGASGKAGTAWTSAGDTDTTVQCKLLGGIDPDAT